MAGTWLPSGDDPRDAIPAAVGELGVLRENLTRYRLTIELKCDGLSPEQLASCSVPPSSMSLLGLVRHLAFVEHTWFQRALQHNLTETRPFWSAEDPDLDFDGAVGTPECVEEAFATWQREIERADTHLSRLHDHDMSTEITFNNDGATTAVRDILVHMVEEYARHCGHADLLREAIDGRTGD